MRRITRVSVNGRQVFDVYTDGSGQELQNVHLPSQCKYRYCVIHHPWPGPWQNWPTFWRSDKRIMERTCYHGVGHPAAEEYLFHPWTALDHTCCGCPCTPTQDAVEAVRKSSWFIDGEIVEPRLGLPAGPDQG